MFKLELLVSVAVFASVACASPICLSGSGATANTPTACVTQSTYMFNQTLNWSTAFGSADRNPLQSDYNPQTTHSAVSAPWVAAGGTDVASVSLGPNYGGSGLLSRADNTEYAFAPPDCAYGPGAYTYCSASAPNPQVFAGHFANTQDWSNFPNGIAEYNWGDNLLLAQSVTSGSIAINFTSPATAVGFRISTLFNSDFIATITAYTGLNGTGTAIDTYSLNTNGSGLGGVCQSLIDDPSTCGATPFVGDAPFVALQDNSSLIKSLTIATNDVHGFAIDTLFAQVNPPSGGSVPEPAVGFLLAGGFATIALLRRKVR